MAHRRIRNTLCAVWKRAGAAGPARPGTDLWGADGAGVDRGCFGDILVGEERAYLFVLKELCAYIALNRTGQATPIALTPLDRLPDALPRPWGGRCGHREFPAPGRGGCTDLVLSRSGAQEAIARKRSNWPHPRNKCDVQVETGEVISLKGRGRARILSHTPTKKGRIALEIFIYGNN